MSNNLITLEFYKQTKKINSTVEDAAISSLISNVSEYIKTYLGRSLNDYVDTEKVEYFRGDKAKYFLSEFPVIEIISVETNQAGNYDLLEADEDYYLDEEVDAITTTSGRPFSTDPKNKRIKVTYKGGYQDIPGELALVTVDLVNYYLKNEYLPSKQMAGVDSIIQPVPEYKLPKHISRVLEMYRQGFAF